jgi:protein phosphatase
MTMTLRFAAVSDPGLIRSQNQDAVYAGPRLLAVADGMGGMAAGDVASDLVITELRGLDEAGGPDALRGAVLAANRRVREAVEADPSREGMGTTLTALLLTGDQLLLAHIGDSRAYRLRDGALTQLTKDDTYVQMLVDQGAITADEASSHPRRALVTRAIQGQELDPVYRPLDLRPGDRYLVCSDGLSNVVSAETLADTLGGYPEPQACARRLVDLALRAGGPDNITAVVADAVAVPGASRVRRVVGAALMLLAVLGAAAAAAWYRLR